MNLNTIQDLLKNPQATPRQLAEAKDWLAGEASYLLEKELGLNLQYAVFFNAERPNYQSDKQVQKLWETTPLGIDHLTVQNTQKRIKLLISAISSHLKVLNDESYNRY